MNNLLELLRARWYRGTVDRFDMLLSKTGCVSLQTAQLIRESWVSLDILGFDEAGLLVWCVEPREVAI